MLGRLIAERHRGVLTERGEGDSFFAVFDQASDAVRAAADIQLAIQREAWPEGIPVKVRMAIHIGESGAGHNGPDYRAPDVNRCARIRAMARQGRAQAPELSPNPPRPVDSSIKDEIHQA